MTQEELLQVIERAFKNRQTSLSLRGNVLTSLPPQLAQLTRLQKLNLRGNQLTSLPPELAQLTNLQVLDLYGNQLTSLPPQLAQLTRLRELHLGGNGLTELPPEVAQLTGLRELYLRDNRLTSLPPQLAQLTRLQKLHLGGNGLTELPPQLAQLTSLQTLDLYGNQLTSLPPEVAQLTGLQTLDLGGNPLVSPPPEVVEQGTAAVLAYLRDKAAQGEIVRYEAKLLLVGEGRAGKSSLLRALRGEDYDPNLPSTHGIEVDCLELKPPTGAGAKITLNTWDFGGQQIYHTTHQYFLTRRSLYLLVFDAGENEAGRNLDYWLRTIQAIAPDAPVLLVATKIDQNQRPVDLNYTALKEAYPQLQGQFAVSSGNEKRGIEELRRALHEHAATLPHVGKPLPKNWSDAEQALLIRTEYRIDETEYAKTCEALGVKRETATGELGRLLHDLGKILYFQDDDILSSMIVLKPNWVTSATARVLDDKEVEREKGILRHDWLPRIWGMEKDGLKFERPVYPAFLRLMERFEISYQIAADTPAQPTTRSLIPLRLPHQPPDDLPQPAPTLVTMLYKLDFVPAGIMSRFLVRTHPYTRTQHWRDGAALEYENHLARVELNTGLREIRLQVWGAQPHNFFTILMKTLDEILKRFEGLRVERLVPCICQQDVPGQPPCPRHYRYEDLVRRIEARRETVECPDTLREVSVPLMLYGIHPSTDADVKAAIMELRGTVVQGQQEIIGRLDQQSELLVRNFTRQWNWMQAGMEAECPSTFFLMPGDGKWFLPKNWVAQSWDLCLMCQYPAKPHMSGNPYPVQQPKEWWVKMSPWLDYLMELLKVVGPVGKAASAMIDEDWAEKVKASFELMTDMAKEIKFSAKDTLTDLDADDFASRHPDGPLLATPHRSAGPALRALYDFLRGTGSSGNWGDLYKTPTPDGNILWLCAEHHRKYQSQPLQI